MSGPTKAPTAPINFQSPAPSARINTSGSKTTRASPVAFQRGLGSGPTGKHRAQREAKEKCRHREPVGYLVGAKIHKRGHQSHADREGPDYLLRFHGKGWAFKDPTPINCAAGSPYPAEWT